MLSVCAKLHNRCIDESISPDAKIETYTDDYDCWDTEEVITSQDMNNDDDDDFVHGRAVEEGERRNNLVRRLESTGVR